MNLYPLEPIAIERVRELGMSGSRPDYFVHLFTAAWRPLVSFLLLAGGLYWGPLAIGSMDLVFQGSVCAMFAGAIGVSISGLRVGGAWVKSLSLLFLILAVLGAGLFVLLANAQEPP